MEFHIFSIKKTQQNNQLQPGTVHSAQKQTYKEKYLNRNEAQNT